MQATVDGDFTTVPVSRNSSFGDNSHTHHYTKNLTYTFHPVKLCRQSYRNVKTMTVLIHIIALKIWPTRSILLNYADRVAVASRQNLIGWQRINSSVRWSWHSEQLKPFRFTAPVGVSWSLTPDSQLPLGLHKRRQLCGAADSLLCSQAEQHRPTR